MSEPAFGDSEPEDAWHPEDPPAVMADNLAARLALVGVVVAAAEDLVRRLVEIDANARALKLRRLSERDRLRVAQILEDVGLALRRVRGR